MSRNPNVIYILADDMGYGDFSAFNPGGPETPAIDSLIKQGVTLENCYSASPVCAPARASILTGRYPQRCGVIDTLEVRGYDRLKLSETTLANVFHDNGYQTALVGKWHLGAIDPEYHPMRRGFDEFFGFRGGWNDYFNYHVEKNGQSLPCEGKYITDLFSDEAARYVKTHAQKPFFLHLAYNAPHFPLQAPQEVVDKYAATGKYNKAVSTLYAMIEIMDKGIGRLIDALKEADILENTIIVFASDNGPDFGGEGDKCQKRFNCDLRGEKMLAYEGGIKVPAVVRYPKRFRAGSRCDAVVHGTDWFPTLLSLCGIPLPKNLSIDGIDVSGILAATEEAECRRLFWQWCRYRPDIKVNSAARDGDMKLVHAPVWDYLDLPAWEVDMDVDIKYHPEHFTKVTEKPLPEIKRVDAPQIQLFDLAADPLETNDIASSNPDIADELEARLQEWFIRVEKERLE